MYQSFAKRLLDLVLATTALIVLLPVLAIIAVLVKLTLGSPVIFHHRRAGKNGRLFMLHKFRTMTRERDASGCLFPDDRRLTRFGDWLRKTSLDELPQLWNVLRGDMSLVGPRPLLPEYLPRYSFRQLRRHDVLPGITGWAQVTGRNSLDWDERLERDAWYVDHVGFGLDIKILAMTLGRVRKQEGVCAAGYVTMPEFTGGAPLCLSASRDDSANRPVHVIGAGGHAKVVIATLEQAGWTVARAYDDNPALWGTSVLGCAVDGPISKLAATPGIHAVIGIGHSATRERIASQLPLHWISVVHPSATVHPSVKIADGTVVLAGAVVQPDATLGKHVIVNTAATVDHDCIIGHFANVGPGAHLAGSVTIGARSDVGTGCSIIPFMRVGDDSVLGAGTVVIRDIPDLVVAAGCPARVLRTLVKRSTVKTGSIPFAAYWDSAEPVIDRQAN